MALMVRPEPFSREVDRLFDAFFGQSDRPAAAGFPRWTWSRPTITSC